MTTSRARATRAVAQAGVSLVELTVSLGLMSLVMTLAGSAIFLALSAQGQSRANSVATKDLRQSISMFGMDATRAETVDLNDGGGPVTSIVITWTDGSGALRTSTFAVSTNKFTRDLDGNVQVLARNVTAVAFNRTGKTLELDLTVETTPDETKSQSLKVYAGRLP